MANHKRRKAKKQRAGCLLCKPHKMPGSSRVQREPYNIQRALQVTDDDLDDVSMADIRAEVDAMPENCTTVGCCI